MAFVVAWIGAGFLLFSRAAGLDVASAALSATCLSKSAAGWGAAYQSFTEIVVFGAVASVVVTNVTRKYQPEATARALAAEAVDHVVVVGFTHLGRRVRDLAAARGGAVVVVEEDARLVSELVRDEEPVVLGSPRERDVLAAARVDRAKVVVLATDDLETAAVACRAVRALNADCELVVRCADEDVGAVLSKTYRARALSTTRAGAEFVRAHAAKVRARSALVVGDDAFAARVSETLSARGIAVTREPDVTDGRSAEHVELVVLCDDDLGRDLIRVDRIRDVNRRVPIVCRAFHEDAAEVLTREPFSCIVLSTSRHAAEALERGGVFRDVGAPEEGIVARAAC